MRLAAAAATIGACILVSFAVNADRGGEALLSPTAIVSADAAAAYSGARQTQPSKPGAGVSAGNDSCRYARDNECDEPEIGTGLCARSTDSSDCQRIRQNREDDSCQFANDGECDEPRFGTGACVQGSDRTDCGDVAFMRNQTDACRTSFNGICEEPGRGNGACEARSDRSDCHGRQRPRLINDHFFGRDDRVRINAQQAPWRYMGRIVNASGEACTATLVGRNVLVTAAHCIHTQAGVTTDVTFTAENGGATARGTHYLVSPRYNYMLFSTTDEIDGLDWALIRIDQPLGERLGFAGVRNITGAGLETARAASLYQGGYSWDTGETIHGNVNCHIVQTHPDNTFAHECDTTRGDSGSAFLVRNGQRFDVVGVDSNFRSNPDGPFIYIAVSAASFQPSVADFIAGRTGIAFGASAGAKPK
jgi:protease YdgD